MTDKGSVEEETGEAKIGENDRMEGWRESKGQLKERLRGGDERLAQKEW